MASTGTQISRGPINLRGRAIDREWTRFSADSGTLGIPRSAMPQIAAEHRGAMVNFLNARGIEHDEMTVPASTLRPTQAEFSEAKVRKAKGYSGGDRAILVASDGHILDGHHQWVAAYDEGKSIRVIRIDAPIGSIINELGPMPSARTASGDDLPVVVVPSQGMGTLMRTERRARSAPRVLEAG